MAVPRYIGQPGKRVRPHRTCSGGHPGFCFADLPCCVETSAEVLLILTSLQEGAGWRTGPRYYLEEPQPCGFRKNPWNTPVASI
jgi:hypothetical protein